VSQTPTPSHKEVGRPYTGSGKPNLATPGTYNPARLKTGIAFSGTAGVGLDVGLRERIDIDSVDLHNFIVALHETIGVDIPEADYTKLATLDSCVEYFGARLGERPDGG
jgi:acyl carrier protein